MLLNYSTETNYTKNLDAPIRKKKRRKTSNLITTNNIKKLKLQQTNAVYKFACPPRKYL